MSITSENFGQENIWACMVYIASLIIIFPFSNLVLPTIVWLFKKDNMPQVAKHGKQVINFQLTASLVVVGVVVFHFLLMPLLIILFPSLLYKMQTLIGLLYMACIVLIAFYIKVTIDGSIAAYNNKPYQFPLSYEFLK